MATASEGGEALFVYGSLLEPELRRRLLGREVAAAPARLPGYERSKGQYFYVWELAGAETSGLLLSGLAGSELAVIDKYEEVPILYRRALAEVVVRGSGVVWAWVYLPAKRLLCSG